MVQLFCSCRSDSLPEPDSTQPETPAGIPDAYQDKIRTQPYPKADNELYLNPAPLIVPQAMKTGERLQFSLSRTEDFSSSETLLSEPQEWCTYIFIVVWRSAHGIGAFVPPTLMELRPVNGVLFIVSK